MVGDWETGFFRSGPVLLEYKLQSGSGKPWMLFLHGFGQDFRCFTPVYEKLGASYSLLSLHLPYHGESVLETAEPLTGQQWADCLEGLFRKLNISCADALAFSMGCKLLLSAVQLIPDYFSSVTLLAPDGLVMNPWYCFATSTAAGRTILKTGMKLYPVFRIFILVFTFLKILRPSLSRFGLSELSAKEGRIRVLNVWLNFRKLWPDFAVWSQNCRRNSIPVKIFLGKYDGILPVSRYRQLRLQETWMEWRLLDSGHAGLIEKFARHASESS